MTVFVQFTDSTETVVKAVFLCAQDPASYPNFSEVEAEDARYLAYQAGQQPTTQDVFEQAVQAKLDASAVAAGYDSILTAVSYVGDPSPTFDGDGKAFLAWRSAVWTYANAQLALVLAGTRAQPTVAEFLTELPALVLPS